MANMFQIKHKNGKIEYLAHNFFFSADQNAKRNKLRPLRELYRNGALEISCCCSSPKVEMLIGYREDTNNYSIKSFPNRAVLHGPSCFYSPNNGESTLTTERVYEKGFTEKDGKMKVKLDTHDFKNPKHSAPVSKDVQDDNKQSIKQASNTNVTSHKATIFALTKRLVTEAWNDSIKYAGKDQYPANDKIRVYESLTIHTLKKYEIEKYTLKDVLYAGEATNKVHVIEEKYKFQTAAFTILLLEDEVPSLESEFVTLKVKTPKKDAVREVLVNRLLYQNALTAINKLSGPYFVGGFLTARGFNKPPEFISFALVPISDYGAPVESSYERELFNLLAATKRKVTRPTRENADASWNGFIPDGLLIDTKPKTIVEIFGMSEDMIDYHERKAIKSQLFRSLQPKYDFWSWDAFQNLQIPPLPSSIYTK